MVFIPKHTKHRKARKSVIICVICGPKTIRDIRFIRVIRGCKSVGKNNEKRAATPFSVPPLSGLFMQACFLVLRADTGVCPYAFLSPLPLGVGSFPFLIGQTRGSAPTRAPKAIQTPLPSGGVGGGLFPSGGVGGGLFPSGGAGGGF